MYDYTKKQLVRLQLWGSLYKMGMQPYDIEAMLADPTMSFDSLESYIGAADRGDQEAWAKTKYTVNQVFNNVSTGVSIIPGYGAVISAALVVVGAIVDAVVSYKATESCDAPSALPMGGSGRNSQIENRKAIVGINPPDSAKRHGERGCVLKHWGSSKNSVESRWGFLVSNINDGAYVWDYPEGSVVGINGKVVAGETKGCESHWEGSIWYPKITLFGGGDSISEKEYKRRQNMVFEILGWMRDMMPYGVLACMERTLLNEKGPGLTYTICSQEALNCKEIHTAKYLNAPEEYYQFPGNTPDVYRRLTGSRYFMTIACSFDALIQMANLIGLTKAREIMLYELCGLPYRSDLYRLNEAGTNATDIDLEIHHSNVNGVQARRVLFSANALEGNLINSKGKDVSSLVRKAMKSWPAYAVARGTSYEDLVWLLARFSNEVKLMQLQQARVGDPVTTLVMPLEKTLLKANRPVPAKRRIWRPSTPVLIGGALALVTSIYLVLKAD